VVGAVSARYRLGINTCFAVKRWPEPERWAELVAGTFELDLVQHSLDLVDLDAAAPLDAQADAVAAACRGHGLELHSTFTGLADYSWNLLLDPDAGARGRALERFRRALAFTARAGGRFGGGHVGAYSASDWADPARRDTLDGELRGALRELAAEASRLGLEAFLVENMAHEREPATMAGVASLLAPAGEGRAAVALCLDVGHQCVAGTAGEERDPYAWLRALGARAPVVHLQQTDADADHHWPFTAALNARGRIHAGRVLEALDEGGSAGAALVLEVVPAFEAEDARVVADLVESVAYWRDALERHGDG
jgi:D-erythrulose 1-phosphate 3-epimerase